MNALKRVSAVIVLVLFGWIAAAYCDDNRMTSEKVNAMVESELPIGSSSDEIELFFKKHGLPFSYDRFGGKYQSIIRDVSPIPEVDQAIVIYLYVNNDMKFTRAEIRDSFTGP